MSVHQYKDGTYYVKYWVPELQSQHSRTFNIANGKASAYQQAVAFDEEIKALKKLGKSLITYAKTPATLENIANDFFKELKSNNKVKQYHRDWRKIMILVVLPILGGIPAEEISSTNIRDLKIAFQNRGNKPATINRYMGYLNQIFNHGIRCEMIDKNPMRFWKKLEEKKPEVKLTVEDAQKIYNAAPDHLKWAMTVALQLVARFGASEVFSLKWSDIDWNKRQLRYYMPKVNDSKLIPLSEDFIEELKKRKLAAKTEYLVEYQGKPIKSIKTAWKTAIKRAQLPYSPRPYDLRHLTISELISKGIPINAVSNLAGHKDIKTTLNTYTKSNINIEREAVEKLPSLAA